jgi:hypothetical protein
MPVVVAEQSLVLRPAALFEVQGKIALTLFSIVL